MSIKRKLYYISVLLCACLLLSACGGKASPETAAETEESSMPETESSVKSSEETSIPSTEESTAPEEDNSRVTEHNFTDILNQVTQKGNDWSSLPLSDNFRNTYNSEEGILEKNNYEILFPLNGPAINYKEKFIEFEAQYTYIPDRIFAIVYKVHFELDEEGRLDSVEVTEGDEIEMRAEAPIQPIYINVNSCMPMVRFFVQGRREEEQEVEYAITDKFRKYYQDYVGIGLLPDSDYKSLMIVFDLCNYSEKKVVLDAIYADKIIRYNAYFTTDSELRLDSITVEEESVRDREPESKEEQTKSPQSETDIYGNIIDWVDEGVSGEDRAGEEK